MIDRGSLRAGVFAFALLIIPVIAFAVRGDKAIRGITWEWEPPSGLIDLLPKPTTNAKLGIYQQRGALAESRNFAVESFFADWTNYDRSELRANLARATAANRWPMLTVEPWPHQRTAEETSTLFRDIVSGKYDREIAAICEDLNSANNPAFIRWGHEMENVNGRYPWAQADVNGYVSAYRYFVDRCRALLKQQCFFVWSPVGRTELFRYWPGADYVDHIGVSIYGFPEYDLRHFGYVRSFADIFSETYERVSLFDKPVIIAELGVTGSERHQRYWMYRALQSLERFPKLQFAVYYNGKDSPLAWGESYPVPDWTISLSALKTSSKF